MAKITVAALEAQLAEQKAAFDTQRADLESAFASQAENILMLTEMVSGLGEAVRVLNERLGKAGAAFKELRAEIDSLRTSKPVVRSGSRAPVKQQPNLWFVALRALREERGLHETAFVPRADVMARMKALADQPSAVEA